MASITDRLRSIIQNDLYTSQRVMRNVWRDVAKQPVEPSPQQRWSEFLAATPDQRTALAADIGPEAYKEHVDEMMGVGSQFIRQAAFQLEPYFMQDVAGMEPTPVEDPSVMLQSMMDEALKGIDLNAASD